MLVTLAIGYSALAYLRIVVFAPRSVRVHA
jgi:hypothetical protein